MTTETDDPEYVYFDPENPPDIELDGIDDESAPGLAKLADLGVVDLEIDERDGDEIVTNCRINVRYLSAMATEFHVVERRYGDRWELGSWNPEIRILDD